MFPWGSQGAATQALLGRLEQPQDALLGCRLRVRLTAAHARLCYVELFQPNFSWPFTAPVFSEGTGALWCRNFFPLRGPGTL